MMNSLLAIFLMFAFFVAGFGWVLILIGSR